MATTMQFTIPVGSILDLLTVKNCLIGWVVVSYSCTMLWSFWQLALYGKENNRYKLGNECSLEVVFLILTVFSPVWFVYAIFAFCYYRKFDILDLEEFIVHRKNI